MPLTKLLAVLLVLGAPALLSGCVPPSVMEDSVASQQASDCRAYRQLYKELCDSDMNSATCMDAVRSYSVCLGKVQYGGDKE